VFSVVPEAFMPGGLTREEAEAAGVVFDYDPEKATALLEEAGVSDLTIDLITSEMPAYRSNYEVLQAELAEVGITVNLNVVDHATMHEQIRQDVNPITLYVAFRPNADVYLTNFYFSESAVVDGASPITNFSHYGGIDELILEARAETDPEKQDELWKQANTQVLKDAVAMPLHYQNQVYARNPKVDYGHELISSLALYPQITELTTITE
jgi:peptide/nickel transport system substrate-binding protein